MKNYYLTILTCLFSGIMYLLATLPAGAQNNKKIEQIEKSLEEVMNLSNCPGMAIAVVKKDQIIYAKGFGYRDYENKKPVTTNTLFAIGSCTKSFTAALIGQLEEKEQLDLDVSPRRYVPKLTFYNAEMNQLITVRDMLSHRTGIPRYDASWHFFPGKSRDSLVQRIEYMEPKLGIRQEFLYNNFMYMTAGVIVEKLSGKSWEENVISELFIPLEMDQSGISIADMEKSDDIAIGYSLNDDKSIKKLDYYRFTGMAPAGSINSNVMDMSKWLITWIYGGKYKGKEVIPNGFVNEAIISQVVASANLPGNDHPDLHLGNYGFGWFLSSYRGHYRVEHGGNINGFSASACFFPTDSIGIIVLVNQNNSYVRSLVRNMVADKILGLTSGNWNENLKKQNSSSKDKEKDETVSRVSNRISNAPFTHVPEDYTGKYNHPGFGTFHVALRHDSLFAIFPTKDMWLRHQHYDIFQPIEAGENGFDTSQGGSFFSFHIDLKGGIDGLFTNVEQGLDPIFFKKETKVLHLTADDLAKYTGEYDLGGAMATVSVTDEKALTLLIPGQANYTLIALDKHKFIIKNLEGYGIEFEEAEGKIKALIFLQPNGNFRVPKKL